MFEEQTFVQASKQLNSDIENGLSEREAKTRYQTNGKNALAEPRKRTIIEEFFDQLNTPLIYVLFVAAAVSILLNEISDAVIIMAVVILNGVVGVIQEGKAQRALESLKNLTSPTARVIRDGKEKEIPALELVTGDLVCLGTGCQVPADLRLTKAVNLQIEESALTGESMPIQKDAAFTAAANSPLGDRKNMAYMSTMVTGGRGEGLVTATGMQTEIGKIAALINEHKNQATPLQKRLGDLGKLLSIISVVICVLLFVIAILQKRNIFDMLITAISLAVAAVPEGLPAVVTICLALSVTKMVKVHTIVRKLPAIETLGAVSVVCSDKTGTLTQNKMSVVACYANQKSVQINDFDGSQYPEFLQGLVLCNDGILDGITRIGDPTELALLDFAGKYKITRAGLEQRYPRQKELSFDSNRKMMSTWHPYHNTAVTFTKGAPDEILKKCQNVLIQGQVVLLTGGHKRQIKKAMQEMSAQALRTLAVAMRRGDREPKEKDLTFLGMVGMEDPIRPEARTAVQEFKNAGVTTVMITGDHVDTAFAIARQLDIVNRSEQCMTGEELQKLSDPEFLERIQKVRVFARVSPEHKVRIVKAFQQRGNIVAMTGDGVNDAPSLKSADIGVAMGMGGTDVAKQASDMILTDDNFATIEKAIEEGRGVYENIKKSVIFLLSSNFGEIMTMFVVVLCGLASPLKSSHILWINLITDSLPALALGADQNDGKGLMQEPPRKKEESLFAHGGLTCTLFYGALIAGISLTAFLTVPFSLIKMQNLPVTLENISAVLQSTEVLNRSQTYAFTVLGMSQLFHALGMRDVKTSFLRMKHFDNKLMFIAFIMGFLLQISVTEIPFLTNAFGTVSLSLGEWGRLAMLAAFPLLAHELLILFQKPAQFRRKNKMERMVHEIESLPIR